MENLDKIEQLERDLCVAIAKGELKEFESIINSLELPSDSEWLYGYNLLYIALGTKQYDAVNFLMCKNVPVNNAYEKYRSTPLHWAVNYGNVELV